VDSSDWSHLLARAPRHLLRLRAPAPLYRLHAVEAMLSRALPLPFRSFLLHGDGGFVGDSRVYGTGELLAILRHRQGSPRPSQRSLLPFHPVDRFGIECLDLDGLDAPVVWCHTEEPEEEGVFTMVHPLAIRVVTWRPVAVQMDPTYVDFLDWLLDQLQGLRLPEAHLPGWPARG
jgi:hypothetical protein